MIAIVTSFEFVNNDPQTAIKATGRLDARQFSAAFFTQRKNSRWKFLSSGVYGFNDKEKKTIIDALEKRRLQYDNRMTKHDFDELDQMVLIDEKVPRKKNEMAKGLHH